MGRTLGDVKAVLLTHGHSDHLGFAEKARQTGIRVAVHELDRQLATFDVPNPGKDRGPLRPMPMLKFLIWGARHGLLRLPKLREVSTFGSGATLDVPGAPTVIHVPGHTPGSAAIHFPAHGALMVGDALCTYSVTNGGTGPRLAPFCADADQALASLDRLRDVPARLVLPGHGEPWTDGADSAATLVQQRRW
jgi:glyoxylase-like metal-dependent hydrolase (beta-lactamase superfamily II)